MAEKTERLRKDLKVICARYVKGETLNSIGKDYGVSREYIRQMIALRGVSGKDSGLRKKTALAKAVRQKQREEKHKKKIMQTWGMTEKEYKDHCNTYGDYKNPGSPMMRYRSQLGNARSRNIAWEFTFKSWWNVWEASGKWENRGLGDGKYVMARNKDIGSYSPDNVFICTCSENILDGYINNPASERNRCKGMPSKSKGYYKQPEDKGNKYVVYVGRKYIGIFLTEKDARDAYAKAWEEKLK